MLIKGFQLIVICHVHINQCLLTPSGKCNVSTPRSEHNWIYCCDNYEDINNTCIECEVGYSSLKGRPCEPCSNGIYGRRCVKLCNCKENERCDHVVGCLNLSTTEDKGFYRGKTLRFIVFGISSIQQTITESFIAENITRNEYTRILGIQPILIYIICAGFVTMLVTITSAIMIYRKKRQHEKPKEDQRITNEEQDQTENIETDHYLTVL